MRQELQQREKDIHALVQASQDMDTYWFNKLLWSKDKRKRWKARCIGRQMYSDHVTEQIHSTVIQARKMMDKILVLHIQMNPMSDMDPLY